MTKKSYSFQDDLDQDRDSTDDQDEAGREVDLAEADKQDRYDGDDKNLKDKDTGETAFDDLRPRLKPAKNDQEDDDEESDGEDADADEEEEVDEDEDTDEEPSKKKRGNDAWRRRLLRAERLIEEVRDENRDLTQRNEALETKFTKRETTEKLAEKKQEAERKLVDVRAKLKAAKEAGNTDDEMRLTEEMAEIKADLKAQEIMAENAKQADETAPAVKRQPRLARQWLRKHQRYHTDQAFQSFVKVIDRQVAAEGYDANSDEYWEELDSRVKGRFPEEYGKVKRRNNDDTPQRRRHPARGSEGDDSPSGGKRRDRDGFVRRGSKVVLTPRQLKNMSRFGLDPDSDEDRKAYVRENMSR